MATDSPSRQGDPSCPASKVVDAEVTDLGRQFSDRVPSAQARPTSTSEMRRDRPGQRDAPESDEAARASSRSTVALGGVAIQMTVDECIELAERESES